MLKKVFFFDVLIGLFVTVLLQITSNEYSILFLLGLAVASISFAVSGVATNNYLANISIKYGAIMSLANFAKVIIVCIIGATIFNNNVNNVISYIMGFTSHFFALLLYGIVNILSERK